MNRIITSLNSFAANAPQAASLRKMNRIVLVLIACSPIYVYLFLAHSTELRLDWAQFGFTSTSPRYPPLYEACTDAEKMLPQHDKDLPFPEGEHGRYLFFANELAYVGVNNQLTEMYAATASHYHH